jgi:hypothetical protein
VYLWSNSPEKEREIRKLISRYPLLKPELYNSPKNIGGFGRFYYARKLISKYEEVIFIDDDIDLESDSLSRLLADYKPKSIHSFYAFRFRTKHDYYSRKTLRAGQEADYCGTGGMICDISIFSNNELFKCPKQYWFIEDLWLSYFAKHKLGWGLYKSGTRMKIVHDGLDQWVTIGDKKTAFLQYLIGEGWQLTHIDKRYSPRRLLRVMRKLTRDLRT